MRFDCYECGEVFDTTTNEYKKYTTFNGDTVCICTDCYNNHYVTCCNCGELEHNNNAIYSDFDDDYLCEGCYNDTYCTCEVCERVIGSDDITRAINSRGYEEYVCSECLEENYHYCEDCENYYHSNNINEYYINGRYAFVCDACYDDNYNVCGGCGDTFLTDDMTWDNYDEEHYCDNCYRSNNDIIYQYHDFRGGYYVQRLNSNDESIPIGMELEVETVNVRLSNNYLAKNFHDNIFHCEYDSSVNGFEIISQPLTFNKWNDCKFRKDLKERLKKLSQNGVRSYDAKTCSCGLHMHVSRNAINNVARLDCIVNLFKDELTILSRRELSRLDRWASFRDGDSLYIKNSIKQGYQNGRYSALNLEKRDTVEFRLFRGTLNINSIYAYLELVNKLVKLANSNQTIIRFGDVTKNTKYLKKYVKRLGINENKTIELYEFKGDNLARKLSHFKEVKKHNFYLNQHKNNIKRLTREGLTVCV